MIEILFSDSACGSLKIAQRFGRGEYQEGTTGIIINHADGSSPSKKEIEAPLKEVQEKARLAWEKAVPLGGSAADIYGFHLSLSMGDISENQPGVKRKQTLEKLYCIYPDNQGQKAADELIKRAIEALKTVRERIDAGENLRIWYSHHPDEMCGLYWFMMLLSQWNVPSEQIFTVTLPLFEVDHHGNVLRKNSWGEVAPEEWHNFINRQEPVSSAYVKACADHWQVLQMENAPLRAMLNGQLVSMPETLYDDFILREMAAEDDEFHEAMLIGRILGRYQLGVGDAWLAFRIEEMIHAGKLEVVNAAAQDRPSYHRTLKKCSCKQAQR